MRTIFRRRKHSGGALVTILLVVLMAMTGVLAVFQVCATAIHLSSAHTSKAVTLTLAESGVDYTVEKLRANQDFPGETVTLYEDPSTKTRIQGTFTTVVSKIDSKTKKIVSTGTLPGGQTRQVIALARVSGGKVGAAAILCNGDIRIGGNATVKTLPQDQHSADVYANKTIDQGGSSQVDGRLYAGETVVRGSGYYPNVNNAPLIVFPSPAEIETRRAAWEATAKTGGSINPVTSGVHTGSKYFKSGLTIANKQTLSTLR